MVRKTLENELRQHIFSTGLKGTRASDAKKIEKLIFDTLEALVRDGIDPDNCRNVRIANCHIEAGDDCIVLKSGREFGPCENITVTGCTLVSTSCALKVGTGPWTTTSGWPFA
mgnify:CR=1 FL=1